MPRRLGPDDIYSLPVPSAPALSPDGTRVAYALRRPDRDADRDRLSLWSVATDGRPAAQLTAGPGDTGPAWSPDGSTVAFLRAGDHGSQVWLLPVAGGEPRRLSRLPLGAGRPVWSPDGRRIAVSAPVGNADDAAPVVIERLDYRSGADLLRGRHAHLHVIDVETGTARQITHGDWDAGEPAWSPDGRHLAFPAAMAPDADLTSASAAYVVAADEPGSPRLVGDPSGMVGPVGWTADGTALLVVGRAAVGPGNASLLRVAVDDGAVRDLTAVHDRNVMPGAPAYPGGRPALTPDGSAVLVCVRDRGCTHLWRLDLGTGDKTPLVADDAQVVSGLSLSGARAALIVSDPASFGEVAIVELDGGGLRTLTSHTRDAVPDVELIVPEPREFRSADGSTVHGWLLRDPAAPTPAPLVLDVHGGPHNAWNPAADPAHLYHQVLAADGVSVLLLNPRGSDGYGERFLTGVLGGWGTADQDDLLTPLDQLVAEGVADPARLGLCGYSYGGFMACYLTGRTTRFAAAVAGGVVSDLASMIGTSVEGWMAVHEWGGLPYDDASALRAQSPIERVAGVGTPTLILHGCDDHVCPVGQAEQWFAALRQRGVPARMVLYPGESHTFILDGRPSHRADYNARIVAWMRQHLAARTPLDAGHWQQRLGALAAEHEVPGAALGILRYRAGHEDEVVECAYGVANLDTGAGTTTDTLFEIGSITKTWTATMIMQLVDEGRLDLDAPVVDVLPELNLSDDSLTKQVTMRHLLGHTSGLDGDIFDDTGRGDDCVQKYVARLRTAAVNHPFGVTFSYCNSGYVIAGRVIEVLAGTTWDEALRARLIEPLGLRHTCTLPEQALLHRVAAGHMAEPGQPRHTAPPGGLPRSVGPAGLIRSTVRDVLAFARLHLTGGLAPDGTRVLAAQSVAQMQDRHVELPDRHTLGDSWGLGWIRYDWSGQRLVGHDGGTLGQSAALRVVPEHGLAICLLMNGGQPHDLYQDLVGEIVSDLAGVRMPAPIEPPARSPQVDPARYLGTYERTGLRTEVLDRDGTLRFRTTMTGPLVAMVDEPSHEYDLVPVAEDLFAVRPPDEHTWSAVTFYQLPDGTPYLHFGGRANPKVSE